MSTKEERVFSYNGLVPSHRLWASDRKKALQLDDSMTLRGVTFAKDIPVRVSNKDLVLKLSAMGAFREVTGADAEKADHAIDNNQRLLDALPEMKQVELLEVAERFGVELPPGYVTKSTLFDLVSDHLIEAGGNGDME